MIVTAFLSTVENPACFVEQFKNNKNEYSIDDISYQILSTFSYESETAGTEYIIQSLSDLDLSDKGATYEEICKAGVNKGFELCTPIDVIAVRQAVSLNGKASRLTLQIVTNPILHSNGDPYTFHILNSMGWRSIKSTRTFPGGWWRGKDGLFVFKVRK